MRHSDKTPPSSSAPWIVCHRRFESVDTAVYAFSTEERAYLHAARLIRDELSVLLELDEQAARELSLALRAGRYEIALQLFHEVPNNLDTIEVNQVPVDHFHSEAPLAIPAF